MNSQQSWLELTDKVCVVTGAASGIGAAVAQLLCEQGAQVAMLDRDEQALKNVAGNLKSKGGDVLPVICDISNQDAIQEAALKVLSHWYRCDVLVNNAGLLRAGTLRDVSLQDWQYVLSVNLTGYLLCSRVFSTP